MLRHRQAKSNCLSKSRLHFFSHYGSVTFPPDARHFGSFFSPCPPGYCTNSKIAKMRSRAAEHCTRSPKAHFANESAEPGRWPSNERRFRRVYLQTYTPPPREHAVTPDESIVQPKSTGAEGGTGDLSADVTSRGQGAPATFLFWRLAWALSLAETLLKDVIICLNLLTGTGHLDSPGTGPAEVG